MSKIDQNLLEQWNMSANEYNRHVCKFPTHGIITTLLLSGVVNKPRLIVDFGCGPGNSTEIIADHFPSTTSIIGVDYSKKMIEIAKNRMTKHQNISYVVDNEGFLSVELKNVDLVFFSNSFFHLENKEKILQSFSKTLSRNGMLIFSMYESVFNSEITNIWPYSKNSDDSLFKDMLSILKERNIAYKKREEDREIFDNNSLEKLFLSEGYSIFLSGIIRTQRTPVERISFFSIPAVSKEIFPNIDIEIIKSIANEINPKDYTIQERIIYSFTAERIA